MSKAFLNCASRSATGNTSFVSSDAVSCNLGLCINLLIRIIDWLLNVSLRYFNGVFFVILFNSLLMIDKSILRNIIDMK